MGQPTPALPTGVDQVRRIATAVLPSDAPFADDPSGWLLDFTAIGTAVNLAARVEPLTKTLGRSLLLTEAVAALTQQPQVALGSHSLRGLEAPVAFYAMPGMKEQGGSGK
jgi:class 3 adenylate cyclase